MPPVWALPARHQAPSIPDRPFRRTLGPQVTTRAPGQARPWFGFAGQSSISLGANRTVTGLVFRAALTDAFTFTTGDTSMAYSGATTRK